MSLIRIFRRKRAVLIVLVAIGLLLVPTVAVTAYNGHISRSDPPTTYAIGTVCGDALAGPYGPTPFSGTSSFKGYSLTFSVTDMQLSGGTSGTVTSGSGYIDALDHGGKLVEATFSGMSGTYTIENGEMHVTFSVSNLKVDGVPSPVPELPPVTMSCDTPDLGT